MKQWTAAQIRAMNEKSLRHLYEKQKLSIGEIAKKIDLAGSIISVRLKLYNIKIQPKQRQPTVKRNSNYTSDEKYKKIFDEAHKKRMEKLKSP